MMPNNPQKDVDRFLAWILIIIIATLLLHMIDPII